MRRQMNWRKQEHMLSEEEYPRLERELLDNQENKCMQRLSLRPIFMQP